jgi:RecT family protein
MPNPPATHEGRRMTTNPGRAPAVADGGAVAAELEQREARKQSYNLAEQKVIDHRAWFGRLLPAADQGGIGAEPFAVALLSLLQRNPKLMIAALNDPDSLIYAATDCAARNLWPGEEYWFVPFDDKTGGTGPHVTGMPGWKGEEQQIYRSGMVEAIVCELVYKGDGWAWKPSQMRVPDHEPRDVPHDPENLWKVYGFCHLRGGGVTHPVVLHASDIAAIESYSKAPKQFWQSKWRSRMWLKSCLHFMYDRVPHSAAYNTRLVEAFALAASRYPALSLTADGSDVTADAAGVTGVPAAVPGAAERPVPPATPAPRNGAPPADDGDPGGWPEGAQRHPPAGPGPGPSTIAGHAEPPDHPDSTGEDPAVLGAPVSRPTWGRLSRMFQVIGWTGTAGDAAGITKDQRRIVACLLAARNSGRPLRWVASVTELTEGEVRHALDQAALISEEAQADGLDLATRLARVYAAYLQSQQGSQEG